MLNRPALILCLGCALAMTLAAPLAGAADRWTGDGISWQTPEGWTQKEGSNELRFAQIDLGDGLTLVVSRFPGDVGGTLANVNRWRAQLHLRPVSAGDLEKVTKKVKAGDVTALLTDFTSQDGSQRMLGAILSDEKGGRTWFFKVTGQAKPVGERTDKFQKFGESVRLGGSK
jgi:hypothetical protein